MKKVLFMSILACAFGVFTSCSSDDDVANANETTNGGETTTTETGYGAVAIKVANANSGSRATSSLLKTTVTNVTATSVVPLNQGNYFLVTYHGRNQASTDEASKGMVQIVKADGTVLSELTTVKDRVNFAAADGKTVYIGLDKGELGKDKKYHCAIATLTLTDDYKFNSSNDTIPADNVTGLEGVSVNCITVDNNTAYISTSTGDVNYAADGKTPKSTVNYEGGYYTMTNGTVSPKGNGWSAYWYDKNVKVRLAGTHSTTCYATVGTGTENEEQVEFTCSDRQDETTQTGRVSAALLTVGGNNYLFTCGDQLIAWVYDSSTSKYVNMQDGTIKNDAKEDENTKTSVNCVSGSHTTAVATDGKYVYACTGSSVSKYYLREYTGYTNASYKGNKRFELKAKFKASDTSWAKTNSDTWASANHLVVVGDYIYVAFGYQGFVVLKADDMSLVYPAN